MLLHGFHCVDIRQSSPEFRSCGRALALFPPWLEAVINGIVLNSLGPGPTLFFQGIATDGTGGRDLSHF